MHRSDASSHHSLGHGLSPPPELAACHPSLAQDECQFTFDRAMRALGDRAAGLPVFGIGAPSTAWTHRLLPSGTGVKSTVCQHPGSSPIIPRGSSRA